MAYSSDIILLLHILVIEVLPHLAHLLITLGLILVRLSGTNIYAIFSGTVTYVGFNGAGGYTVTIQGGNFTASYCHVSPYFLVSVNEYVLQGTIIANVGPKNVYAVPNNPYKDSSGAPTNGATTGPHLHLTLKKDGKAVNPLDYISSSSSW